MPVARSNLITKKTSRFSALFFGTFWILAPFHEASWESAEIQNIFKVRKMPFNKASFILVYFVRTVGWESAENLKEKCRCKRFVLYARLLNFQRLYWKKFQILRTLPRSFVGKCRDSTSAEKILNFFDSKFDPATGINLRGGPETE